MDKYLNKIRKLALYQKIRVLLKRVHFFDSEVSLYRIVKVFVEKIQQDEILDRAGSVAFSFTMAIFPGIIFLFTLVPFVSIWFPDVNRESILQFLGELMAPSVFVMISSTVDDIVSNTRGGLLTFGVVFSLYLATNGVMSLINAFNSCYKTVDTRGYIKTRLIATGLTVLLAFALFAAIGLLVIGQILINWVQHIDYDWIGIADFIDQNTLSLLILLRFVVMFLVFYFSTATIYYFGPAIHYNWKFFSAGAFFATFASLVVSYGFSYYVSNFGTYNKLYGSIGVIIALMVWLFFLSVVLLIGYEINASIHKAHSKNYTEKNGKKKLVQILK